jgi:hypothetical protein
MSDLLLIARVVERVSAANMWGIDVRSINAWLKKNVPFHAKVIQNRANVVDIGTDVKNDLGPYSEAFQEAFLGTKVTQPGMKNYLRVIFHVSR